MLKRFLILFLFCLPLSHAMAQELLEPEKAFKFEARARDAKTLEVRFQIADGYYMYRDKFKFAVEPAAAKLGAAQMPPGKVKQDENFGRVETYRKEVKITLPFEAPAGATALNLNVTSQGCADIGVCYPPQTQSAQIKLAGLTLPAARDIAPAVPSTATTVSTPSAATTTTPTAAKTAATAPMTPDDDESSQIARLLEGAGFWLILTTFFGFGLLLSFTPCVLPMVPILSGIIVGHGHNIGKSRALTLSLAYVLGMAVTYAVAGVAAGLSGTLLAAALQNAWVLGSFAVVFVALALSMFGLYELQMPAFLQSRLSVETNRLQGGSLHGVALMGALSAIIVGPCVAAPLAGALLYIAKTGDAVLGGSALFFMALGMGVPLVAVGVSARSLLPQAGAWMEAVKKFFGVLLLGVALWLVTSIIPPLVQMLAWAALLIFPAIYLHALDPLPPHAHGGQRFGKGLGIIALVFGAALLVGALAGSRDPLQPLAILRGPAAMTESPVKFERIKSSAELDARLKTANRPVLLDFYADWCVSCKEMERFTFTDPKVVARMSQMLLLQADVTTDSANDKELLKRFGLFGPPGIIFFDSKGAEVQGLRVIGYQPAERFAGVLDKALAR